MDYQSDNGGGMAKERNVFHLSADMFPEGMADTLKAGEVIEFRIVSPKDKDGDVAVEYNTGDESEPKDDMGEENQEQGSSWEQDLRDEMSPQSQEPQPG